MTSKLSPRAETDLEDISDYTFEEYGMDQEEEYMEMLDSNLKRVGDKPGNVGINRDDVRPGLKSLLAGEHKIWFRVVGKDAHVTRILHQSTGVDNAIL